MDWRRCLESFSVRSAREISGRVEQLFRVEQLREALLVRLCRLGSLHAGRCEAEALALAFVRR